MEDLARYALKLAGDAKYAEVRCEESRDQGFILKNSIPELSGFQKMSGVSIRLLYDGAMGFAATNIMSKSAIKKMALSALKMAKAASRVNKTKIKLSKCKSVKGKTIVKSKINPENFDPKQKINLLKSYDALLKNHSVDIPARQFALEHSLTKSAFFNTEGSKLYSVLPRLEFFWFMTCERKVKSKQRYMLYNGLGGFELFKKWKIAQVLQKEADAIEHNLKYSRKLPKGKFDFILGPELTGIATHESIGHPFESDRIFGREAAQAGESFVSPKMLNSQIGSELITVHENPLIKNSAGYYKFDSEGVRARDKILIKNGRINDFLHSRETAAQLGVVSNGSARANSFDKEPLIRMSNTYVSPGKWKRDELIKETKKGILLDTYMEWNIDDKRFNQKYTGCEAYYVENGEVLYPLDNPVLEISTPDFWKKVDAVAKDDFSLFAGPCGKGEPMQSIPVTMGGPTMRLKGVRVK